jgi:threonine dehydrogenase-like Zn-dependent dehydrogenase
MGIGGHAGMRVAQVAGPGRWEISDAPMPRPGPTEAVVEVHACGVCTYDLHVYRSSDSYPLRLGHEPTGVVADIGLQVKRVAVGDRVTGRLFPSFAEYVVAQSNDLVIVPSSVPFYAALGEPLACLVEAERRSNVALGARVAVVGLGFMGLAFTRLLRLRGAGLIVGIDPRADARQAAVASGADEAFAPDTLPDDYRLTRFEDWETQRGFELVVEASGSQAGLTLAGELVRAHGTLSILGAHERRVVEVGMWNWKAIDVVNAHVRDHSRLMSSMQIGMDLLESGRLSLEPLITHRYSLEGIARAFSDLADKPPGFIKAVIDVRA